MRISEFTYELPPEYIAQHPIEPRDRCRLMALDRTTGATAHRRFFEIVDYVRPGDLLVWNNTKVFKARLFGTIASGAEVEIFLVRPTETDDHVWEVLARPGKKLHVGEVVLFADDFSCTVREKRADGTVLVAFELSSADVRALANAHGHVPVPPYVGDEPPELHQYQTVYAKHEGSVAAPTAGFHFTPALIERLREQGVEFAEVTLHVGLGTFQPMKTDTLEEHQMHSEWVQVSADTASQINRAKSEGRRVIAVGTTTVRTLEGVEALHRGVVAPYSGEVNLFITPGFTFNVIDGLITNFHLPKSTLLVLVSAFAGRERVLAAYEEAKREGYLFYSFGDAMFIS